MYEMKDQEVESILNHFLNKFKYDREEYYGVAAEGLCYALHGYDSSKGICFKTYAFQVMKKCCQRYIRDMHREKRKANVLSFSYFINENGEENDILEYVPDMSDEHHKSDVMDSIISDLNKVMNQFEVEMTLLFMEGYSDEQVAKIMHCSLKDIKNTKSNAYSRTNVMLMANKYRKEVMI